MVEELEGVAEQMNPREPTHEWDAVQLALLAEVDRQADLEEIVGAAQRRVEGARTELRLLGPLAPYDFVVTAEPGG